MNQKNIISIIIVCTALIVFVIASYFRAQKYITYSPPSTPSSTPITSSTPRTLTKEEQAVLNIPLYSAPSEQKIQHTKQVAKLATTAPELDITACKPNPIVYQVSLNGSFKITNNDPIPHTLRYMSSQVLIPAHGSTSVTTSKLFKTSGDYGYGCDNPFAKAGVMVVR